jgi:hypothetical protein
LLIVAACFAGHLALGSALAQPPLPDAEPDNARQLAVELFDRLPARVAQLVAEDPSLLANAAYLAAYPELQAFVADHPELAQNPEPILLAAGAQRREAPADERDLRYRLLSSLFEGAAVLVVMAVVFSAIMWLVRTLLEHRRWSRTARVQAELHTKIVDRFSSNEDLLNYIRTPVGRRFLEAMPMSVDPAPHPAPSAPIGRILWAVQLGTVLMVAGIGLQLLRGSLADEIAPVTSAFGGLALVLGAGFLASAGAAYVLSRRLGLLPEGAAAPPLDAGEVPDA